LFLVNKPVVDSNAFKINSELNIYPIEKRATKPRRRLKKSVKRVLAIVILLLTFLVSIPLLRHYTPQRTISGYSGVDRFIDRNPVHLKYAKANGISPLGSGKSLNEKLEELIRRERLVKVSETKYYTINKLTHSHPYLVPKAKKLLDLIGIRFQKKLTDHQKEKYLFKVTSLLRTQESQRQLRHSNDNATTQSAHLYGTTFDITYKSLAKRNLLGKKKTVSDGEAIRLLSEAIRELQKERKLVVITERNEACFHITVR
jgi:hypothetical protein